MPTILPIDSEVALPDFTLVSASAGSGKTTQLTYRLLQVLMSLRMPHNGLRNVLAVTFTNNAAAEMRQRTLEFLKRAALGDGDILNDLHEFLSGDAAELKRRADKLIDEILDNYSDFQVQTIDSFLTRVTKASALELGIPPQFDIVFEKARILDEAFVVFARDLAEDPRQRSLIEQLVVLLNEQRDSEKRFLWNPYENLASEIKGLYERLVSHVGVPETPRPEREDQTEGEQMAFVFSSTGDASRRGSRAHTYYQPYVQAYALLEGALRKVQAKRGMFHLASANKMLAAHIRDLDIPEIYFTLGERIHHFLIDEFQDTSPTQWAVLRPLIENSLSGPGSAFVVGDTKQAIYTFRGGDWQIMARMQNAQEFPSVTTQRKALEENFRSGEAILNFTKRVFHLNVPRQEGTSIPALSGLSTFEQRPDVKQKGKGYVEVEVFPDPEPLAEKRRLLEIIRECRARKYGYRDIAILTPRNRDVITVSSWLNEKDIPFVSHSNLDIRSRKITGEILTLLRFLDSPVDDLAFATVLLSKLFRRAAKEAEVDLGGFLFQARRRAERRTALYTSFRERYGRLWERYFERLFRVVGYMPIYDLVAEVYKAFALFDSFPKEEASLVKFLEVVRDFEATGTNNLRSFIRYAEESTDDDQWNIAVAPGEDAVRVMTVHKAKGLGFRISLVLFYDALPRPDNLVVVEQNGYIQLIRVTKKLSEDDRQVERLYQEKQTLSKVDELNKLYVSLTRAREELYVLSVKARRAKTPSAYLPESGSSMGAKGEKQEEHQERRKQETIAHYHTRSFAEAKEGISLRSEEADRGEFVHSLLEKLIFVEGAADLLDAQIEEVMAQRNDRRFETSSIKDKIITLVSGELLPYFTKREGRGVMTEQMIVSADGKTHRIDRLVVDPDRVTVIDYKTGAESEEHHGQVRHYLRMVRQLYPGRTVEGLIAYVDLQIVRNPLPQGTDP